jgi:hypothetical protein
LQSLIDAAPADSTLLVPACVFRETVSIDRPLTLQGQPGSEIRGSDVWSSWHANGRLLAVAVGRGAATERGQRGRTVWRGDESMPAA